MCLRLAYCSQGAHQRTARPREACLECSLWSVVSILVSLEDTASQVHTWHVVKTSINQFRSHFFVTVCLRLSQAQGGWGPNRRRECGWIDCGEFPPDTVRVASLPPELVHLLPQPQVPPTTPFATCLASGLAQSMRLVVFARGR